MGPVLYGESGDRPSVFSGRGRVTLSDGRHGRSLKRVRDDADIRATHGKASIARLDRFAVAVNERFDVYSLGPDGASAPTLTAGAGRDDVIAAADGGFVGVAAKY